MRLKALEGNDGLTVCFGGPPQLVGDMLIPAHIEARFDRPVLSEHIVNLVIDVTFMDRVLPEVTSVTVERQPDGPQVTASSMRLPVRELQQEAILTACRGVRPNQSDGPFTPRPVEERDQSALTTLLHAPASGRHAINREHLQEVVTVYRAGEVLGRPVMHVAEHFDVPRPTASRWATEARKRGYFDEPPPESIIRREGSITFRAVTEDELSTIPTYDDPEDYL